jgi:hypothetical protein
LQTCLPWLDSDVETETNRLITAHGIATRRSFTRRKAEIHEKEKGHLLTPQPRSLEG